MEYIKKYARYIPFFIFLLFFTFTLSLRLTSPSLSSGDDPYYHARRAAEIWNHTPIALPAFSTVSDKPVDLYTLYHAAIAPFTYFFHGDNYEALIIGDKVFHSLIDGALFALFFYLLRAWDKDEQTLQYRTLRAMLGTVLLFAISHTFSFRIMLERPHTLSIIFMLLIVSLLVKKKKLHYALLIFLFPFFYSASFLILIPPLVYALATYTYAGFRKLKDAVISFCISCGALALGICARPDSLAYVYNGYGVHLLSIARSVFTTTPGMPAELGNGIHLLNSEYYIPLFILFFVATSYVAVTRGAKVLSEKVWFMFLLASAFVAGSLIVERTIEYAVPFALFYICISTHLFSYVYEDIRLSISPHEKLQALKGAFETLVTEHKKLFTSLLLAFVAILFVAQSVSIVRTLHDAPDYTMYRGAGMYLTTHTEARSIIYIPRFGMFPELFFYAPTMQYSSGMDPTFTYMHDQALYYKMLHLNSGELICGEPRCPRGIDPYTFLRDTIATQYIVLDTRYMSKKKAVTFQTLIERDQRFKLVFQDATFSNIRIYEVTL